MTMFQLDERAIRFLVESNAIEDITNVPYDLSSDVTTGHAGALAAAIELATRRTPLTGETLCQWQGMLLTEQRAFGHDVPSGAAGRMRGLALPKNVRVGSHIAPPYEAVADLIAQWIADINARLAATPASCDDWKAADILGEFFQRFEAIHPFVDGNGRTGRLVCAYVCGWCELPFLIVQASERHAYYRAHRSKLSMRVFMADKVREAVFWPGRGVLERVRKTPTSDLFDGLTVERHALVRKQREWQAAIAAASQENGSG